MRRSSLVVVALMVFLVGAVAGVAIAKKKWLGPDVYAGKSPEEASTALLSVAKSIAGNGTWERIHLARIYQLSGHEEEAQAILDGVLNANADASDWIRAGRLYYQAGKWDKARAAFGKVLTMKPKDEDWLAEIGAYYNLQGNREKAEELFRQSFSLDADSLNNVLNAAGSYVGVAPRKR